MRGLVPRIYANTEAQKDVDARDKRGHDVGEAWSAVGPATRRHTTVMGGLDPGMD